MLKLARYLSTIRGMAMKITAASVTGLLLMAFHLGSGVWAQSLIEGAKKEGHVVYYTSLEVPVRSGWSPCSRRNFRF